MEFILKLHTVNYDYNVIECTVKQYTQCSRMFYFKSLRICYFEMDDSRN